MKTILSLILIASPLFASEAPKDPKDAEIAVLKAQIAVLNAAKLAKTEADNKACLRDLTLMNQAYASLGNTPSTMASQALQVAQAAYDKTLAESCKVKPDIDGCPKKTP